MYYKKIAVYLLMIAGVARLSAQQAQGVQNPPVVVEALAGNRSTYGQLFVMKKFHSAPKVGFFSVATMNAAWEKETLDDVMNQGALTYSLAKGLDIFGGYIYTVATSFRTSAGLIYSTGKPHYTVVLAPRIDLSGQVAAEIMALAEYKPAINEQWRAYSRLQLLYAHTPATGEHARSYVMLRAGLKYNEFAFGAGSNFDWYGPAETYKLNAGAFLNFDMF